MTTTARDRPHRATHARTAGQKPTQTFLSVSVPLSRCPEPTTASKVSHEP